MKLDLYQTPDGFLSVVQDELAKREAFNNLMLGLALRLLNAPERFKHPRFFAAVTDQSALTLAALMIPPNNLILYSSRSQVAPAVDRIAAALHEHGRRVPGVVGPSQAVQLFAEAWTRLTGLPHRPAMMHGIFELRRVEPPGAAPGALRAAGPDDLALLTEWSCAFQREALAHLADPADVREVLELRTGDGDIFVWDDGGPVSMAIRGRPTLTGISIGSVYTPPGRRGKGYASAGVAALSQLCLDSGYTFCMLYTDLSNPTSNRIYQKIGYRPIGESSEYRFGDARP
jgi:uncharacterized protein